MAYLEPKGLPRVTDDHGRAVAADFAAFRAGGQRLAPAAASHDGHGAEQITPIVRTEDAETAVAWYARFGFTKDWEHRFELGSRCSCPSPVDPWGSFHLSTTAMPARTPWST
jgi:hypothetical protein